MTTPPPESAAPADAHDLESLLADLRRSGKSTAAFARERGVPAWRLYNALRSRAKKRTALVPVVIANPPTSNAEPIELALSSGHRLRISANFDEQALRRLMGVLAGC
jgi:lambda repressor-like predicted transcriptional regulator